MKILEFSHKLVRSQPSDSLRDPQLVKKQFLYLLWLVSVRYFSNFLGVVFSWIFPIVWLIASFYIWGKHNEPSYFVTSYITLSLMPTLSLGLMSFPINFGSDRISKITKFYATLNISQEKYFIANLVISGVQFLIITNIILLLGNFLFVGDLLPKGVQYLISAKEYFGVLFSDVYIYVVCFIFSLGISLIGKSFSILYTFALVYYYVNLFTSGVMIPIFAYDPNAAIHPDQNWFKWLEYWTPIGAGCRLDLNIVLPDAWTWNADWLCFVSPLVQAVIILYFVEKNSIWRYHRVSNIISIKQLN